MKIISNLILIFALYYTFKYILVERLKFKETETILKITKFLLAAVLLILVFMKIIKLSKLYATKSNKKNS